MRVALGGWAYHVLNRANGRRLIFRADADYEAFERVLEEAAARIRMRVLSYCVMPNHWHLVLWPRADGDLSRFVGWLTLTHTQRWHAHRGSAGTGHVYQGRFRSFVVQSDEHLLTVCRYVERNPLRAKLVNRAEDWRWSSLWRWRLGSPEAKAVLSNWPVTRPRNWLFHANQPQTELVLEELQQCVNRGRPFGAGPWIRRTVGRLGLESTMRPRGRPRREQRIGS